MTDEKPFRCKLCKEEFDNLSLIELHISEYHLHDNIEWLPKSKERCPYTYVSLTGFNGTGQGNQCQLSYGHKGEHQKQKLYFPPQLPPRQGWIKP